MIKRAFDNRYACHALSVISISLLCIIIYSNTWQTPLLFDDKPNIEHNQYIQLKSIDFQKLWLAGFKSPNSNRPVANISIALNYYFGGFDVAGYHLVNIVIHLINGVLVYFLALILFRQLLHIPGQKLAPSLDCRPSQSANAPITAMALFSALIFVAHPVQSQSVTYIVQRMNSMAVMFYLLSFLLYLRGRLTQIGWRRWVLFLGGIVSWSLALGSKEIAATLPFIILLTEWYFFQDLSLNWLRQDLKYLLLPGILLVLVALIFLGSSLFERIITGCGNRDFTVYERLLTQFRVVIFYITLLLYPHPSRLNLNHYIKTSHSLLDPSTTVVSLLIILVLLALAIYLARRERLISFCILWFLINLVIESSVICLEMIFEHRLYLPMFGFSLLLSYLLFCFMRRRRICAILISLSIVLSLGTATYLRNMTWQDAVTLWSDSVSKSPQYYRPHYNLALALQRRSNVKEALEHYSEAVRLKPDYVQAHVNLGIALGQQGKLKEAIMRFSEALRISPDYAKAHENLGAALVEQGRLREAVEHCSEALRLKPGSAKIHYNLGVALARQEKFQEAAQHLSEALRIEPGYNEARRNLKRALRLMQKTSGVSDSDMR